MDQILQQFKPCITCGGELQLISTTAVETPLPAGLNKVVGNARPILVPAGSSWSRYHWIVKCSRCSTYLNYVKVMNGDQIMAEAAEPTSAKNAKKATRKELLEKVRRLSETIESVTAQKKEANADYNDQLKANRDELHDTLDLLKDTPEDGTTAKT